MPKPLACPAIILCLRKAIEMKTPTRILMVCLGNICRSPLAEYVLRQQLQQAGLAAHVQGASAGTSGWHNGENMHQGSLKEPLRPQGAGAADTGGIYFRAASAPA